MKLNKYLVTIFFIIFVIFIPFLKTPELLTNKNNDLGRNYVPMFSFLKESTLSDKELPLWRPSQLMGETFVGNPLSTLFYPANIIFILIETKTASIIYLFFHFILAAFSTYFTARNLKLSKSSSFAASIFYSLSIKIVYHAIAGHITMIAAFSLFPLTLLSTLNFLKKNSFNWFTLGAVSLTFTYFTYPTIFYYSVIFIIFCAFYKFLILKMINNKNFFTILLMIVVGVMLSMIILIPNLEFARLSTRNSLTLSDVAIPLWNLKKISTSLVFPYINLDGFDQEEILYVGLIPTAFSLLGFFYLKKAQKIALSIFGLFSLMFAAGISTPLFPLAYKFVPLLKYSRVTTRFYFIVILIISLLAAYGLNKTKNKKLTFLAILIFSLETLYLGYSKLQNTPNLNFGNQNLYDFLSKDKDKSRVYCTSNCFNSQLLTKNQILILNGENPIQHKNSIEFLKKAGNYNFSSFAVIFPPYQVWQTQNPPQPNSTLLGSSGAKYIASTYALDDKNFKFIDKFNNTLLYENNNFKNIARFKETDDPISITKYTPNTIEISYNPSKKPRTVVFAENYYPGWYAYSQGNKLNVESESEIFRKVIAPPGSNKISMQYQPKSLKIGSIFTTITIISLSFYAYYLRQKPKKI